MPSWPLSQKAGRSVCRLPRMRPPPPPMRCTCPLLLLVVPLGQLNECLPSASGAAAARVELCALAASLSFASCRWTLRHHLQGPRARSVLSLHHTLARPGNPPLSPLARHPPAPSSRFLSPPVARSLTSGIQQSSKRLLRLARTTWALWQRGQMCGLPRHHLVSANTARGVIEPGSATHVPSPSCLILLGQPNMMGMLRRARARSARKGQSDERWRRTRRRSPFWATGWGWCGV
jgi:hypothetical protein